MMNVPRQSAARWKPESWLVRRQRERTALLHRLVGMLQADTRVCAAWLFGSLARGDADALSDLDLWVVVEDAHVDPVIKRRAHFVARPAEPLLQMSVWSNAPPYGAYMLVHYPGATGPHQVDWYWQPRAHASIPDDMHVLFDRVGLPRTWRGLPIGQRVLYHPRVPLDRARGCSRVRAVTDKLTYFWAMTPITAKSIVRNYADTVAFLLEESMWALQEVRWLLEGAPLPTRQVEAERARLAAQLPSEQIASLHEAGAAADALTQPAIALGASVPTATIPYIDRLLNCTAHMLQSQNTMYMVPG